MTIVHRIPVSIPVLALAAAFLPIALPAENMKVAGVPAFEQVNEHVYRGGQPDDLGWHSLAQLGVKTVIDLRRDGEDGGHSIAGEARAVEGAGMRFISVPMQGAPSAPTDEQIAQVLNVLSSGEPVFVHCKKGKDRTGTAIACYRIAHDGWKNRQALAEAKSHGLHWYEIGMQAYILGFDPGSARLAGEHRVADASAGSVAQ